MVSSPYSSDRLPAEFVRSVALHQPEPEEAPPVGVAPPFRPDGQHWLRILPELVERSLQRWRLEPEAGEPLRWGFTALVIPVLRPEGDRGMLKIGWPHPEADVEHLALRAWKGRGAVRLLAAEPADTAYLLERLDPELDLTTGSVLDASESLGQLLRALDRPAPPWAPPWRAELARLDQDVATALADPAAAHRFPRRMLQHAAALLKDVRTEPESATSSRLVHTDLHHGNALWRPDPGEWVAIDPKVVAGDPHWAVAPALWNRWEDALAAHDLGAHLRRRLQIICEAAGLDQDRARAMTILRLTQNALWAIRDDREDTAADVTTSIAVIKAMHHS